MAESDTGDTSDRYEFDAPTLVVDLNELQNAEIDDNWFEQQTLATDGHLKTPSSDGPFRRSDKLNLPKAIVTPQVKLDVDSGPSTSATSPLNIVTSWGPGSPTRTDAQPKRNPNQPPAQPCRVPKRKGLTSGPAAPPSKKHKKSPVARPAKKSGSSLRKTGQRTSRTVPKAQTAASTSTTASTEPNSSEEQELERIRNLQKEVALHRKKNEASYKAALAGNPPPKKMVLSTTVPKEFHFNGRAKASASSSTEHKEEDFISQLRKPSSPARALKGATVPKPFNLSTGNKRKAEEQATYVPMAQQIKQFERQTPDRYHLRSRKCQERGPSPVKRDHLKLTQPQTPHLMTHQRSRPPTIKSSADLEAEELEKLHNFQFKAQELNKKILEGAEVPKKPAVKEPTVPEGFMLQIDKRLQERQVTKPQEDEEKPHNFKSQPLPKKILDGVVGVPEKKVLPLTLPESPAFALKKRIHTEPRVVEVKKPSPVKAPPVPHFGLPFQPRLPEKHNVEVCPFSFEERERERKALKEKRLAQQQNEEVPQFKAQPLPDFDTVALPEKKKLEPTKPEPFKLLINERGAVKNIHWEQKIKEEKKQLEEAAIFKARRNTVTHKEPFQPRKENRSSVAVETFKLSTERRARERQEYEQKISENEARRMLQEEAQRRGQEQKEKEEIARLRQEQVHKAQPVRHYKPVSVKKSDIPLTIPQSPNFSDRFHL